MLVKNLLLSFLRSLCSFFWPCLGWWGNSDRRHKSLVPSWVFDLADTFSAFMYIYILISCPHKPKRNITRWGDDVNIRVSYLTVGWERDLERDLRDLEGTAHFSNLAQSLPKEVTTADGSTYLIWHRFYPWCPSWCNPPGLRPALGVD